ncbi:hypothetical protein CWI39_3753p0020, partial [Hamiltosporidium magnivora]
MKVLLEIPDNEAIFAFKVLKSLSFVKKAKPMSMTTIDLWEDLKEASEQTLSMSYNIFPTHRFEKELKRLAKKFPSLKNEFAELIRELLVNPESGTFIGNNCYKIRLAIGSKGKGKSGGARVITYLYIE